MKRFGLPVYVRWSGTQTAIASLILAIGFYAVLHLLRVRGVLPPPSPDSWKIGEFADVLAVVAVLVGLLGPLLVQLAWHLIKRVRPRPGSEAFAPDDRTGLRRAFEVDRAVIAAAMVPSHLAAARPATSARKIDFGDATLTVAAESLDELAEFIARPYRQGARNSPEGRWEREILLVTGEPGAGKSVLLQEIHASLSLGVEAGNHSLVPLILFARDLTVARLERAARAPSPMQSLLADYYQYRATASSADEDLKALLSLIAHQWDRLDCFVLIDGLDEIAQRSAYEVIQRQLATFIEQDLAAIPNRRVHRYLLSCRVDEDLELFPGAANLFLRGLSDRQRERFCQALVDRQDLDRRTRVAMEEALRSRRVSPTHVFRRNPYFLSLLVRHLRDDEDRVRDRTLSFDFLMRKYLEREAVRPHAAAREADDLRVEERRRLFDELERISRPALQFLAFRSAASAGTRALYDEVELDVQLVSEFSSTINSPVAQEDVLWATLHRLAGRAASGGELTADDLGRLGLLRDLHENDVRVLLSQVAQARRAGLNGETILGVLGGLPHQQILEPYNWYVQLTDRLAGLYPGATDPATTFSVLLFARSLGAAHVLRVLYLDLRPGSTTLRFRHRRLAEYYAACYLRDRWPSLVGGLRLSPWLGPVFNLTCALEGTACQTLRWLVREVDNSPRAPAFTWRYVVEAAVEASFFAHPGSAYREAVKELAEKILTALAGSRADSLDAVTEMVLLRALQQLAELTEVLGDEALLTEPSTTSFYAYEAERPTEWIAPILPARLAVQALAKRRPSWGNRAKLAIRLIQQPSVVLFSNFRVPWRGLLATRLAVVMAVLLGEIILVLATTGMVVGLFFLTARQLAADPETLRQAVQGLFAIVSASAILLRLLAWQRSPTTAAAAGTLPWRLPSMLRESLGRWNRERSALLRTQLGRVTARLAALAVGAGLFAFAAYLTLPGKPAEAEPKPCPEIGQMRQQMMTHFPSLLLKPDLDLRKVRQELRFALERLRLANKERCGWERDGTWELVEERVADSLAELDPRLVPLPPVGRSPAFGMNEVKDLERDLAAPPLAEPPPGAIGSLAAFQLSRREGAVVQRLTGFQSRMLAERRAGFGLPAMGSEAVAQRDAPEAIARATAALARIDTSLAAHRAALESLKQRCSRSLLWGAAGAVAFGTLLLLLRAWYTRRRDQRLLAQVDRLATMRELCDFLLARQYSERIRRRALRRIDRLESVSPQDLDRLEQVVGSLLRSGESTERTLGVNAAGLARAISNRLRHRFAEDLRQPAALRRVSA